MISVAARFWKVFLAMLLFVGWWVKSDMDRKADHADTVWLKSSAVQTMKKVDSLSVKMEGVPTFEDAQFLFNQQNERLDDVQEVVNKMAKNGVIIRRGRAPYYKQYGPLPDRYRTWFWTQ